MIFDPRDERDTCAYEGPLEDVARRLHGKELVMRVTISDVEWHGIGTLVRGRLPNGDPAAVFVPTRALLATLG